MNGLVAVRIRKSSSSSIGQSADYLTIKKPTSSYEMEEEGYLISRSGSIRTSRVRSSNEQTVASPKWADTSDRIVVVKSLARQQLIPAKIRMPNSAKARKKVEWCLIGMEGAPQFSAEKIDKEVSRAFRKIVAKNFTNRHGLLKPVDFMGSNRRITQFEASLAITSVDFKPSDELVAIIERGISKFAKEMNLDTGSAAFHEFIKDEAKANRANLIAKKLFDLISTLAFRQGDGLEAKISVTSDGQFNSSYLYAFLDVFPIWPTDLEEFGTVLANDLISYISSGGIYGGSWGKLEKLNDELITMYGKDTVAKLESGWKKAPRLSL